MRQKNAILLQDSYLSRDVKMLLYSACLPSRFQLVRDACIGVVTLRQHVSYEMERRSLPKIAFLTCGNKALEIRF